MIKLKAVWISPITRREYECEILQFLENRKAVVLFTSLGSLDIVGIKELKVIGE